ncbi:MAG: hypothetical protein PUB51_02705 [Oscillospiraceae bacterium]|nr:hypothetical protein [Oscillospiraceae bacterium]
MRRTARDKRPPVKPVERIELSEKHFNVRLVVVVVLLAIGAALIAKTVIGLLRADPGWQVVEVDSAEYESSAPEFVFYYQVGSSGVPAGIEYRQISKLYTETAVKAFRLFHRSELFEDEHNLAYLNRHPNETVEVPPVLYDALSQMVEGGNRAIYLAPVYAEYQNLFFCSYDYEAENYDPRVNAETAEYVAQVLRFAGDPDMVDLELLGGGKVRLKVAGEYQRFAAEMAVDAYLDFFWLKNAFITDYLADVMEENGYTHGTISSYDGFCRDLDDRGTVFSFDLRDLSDGTVYPVGTMEYTGLKSVVAFRTYPVYDLDVQHYYQWESGELRHPYIDPADGLCKSAMNDLVGYSGELGCAQTALRMAKVFIAEEVDEDLLRQLPEQGVEYICFTDRVLRHSDGNLRVSGLYNKNGVQYRMELAA